MVIEVVVVCMQLYVCVWDSMFEVIWVFGSVGKQHFCVLVSKIVRYFINLIFSKIFEVQPK